MESDLLTVLETASLLRLRPSTIRKWLLEKKLSYVKLGRRVFLRRADLNTLLEESFVPAQASGAASRKERGQ
jgi:excisionase family DNA binding protein